MKDLSFEDAVKLRSFYGGIADQMPLLLAGNRLPMTPRQLLEERVRGTNVHDRDLLRNIYVDMACAIIAHPSGEVLVGLYDDPLVKGLIDGLHPKSKLHDGSLPMSDGVYEQIRENAFVISCEAANHLRDRAHHEQKVREAFWDYITEGDASLVRDYLHLVQECRGGHIKKRMGLWLSPQHLGLRLLCAWPVDDDGGVNTYSHLGYDNGRLIGVLETQRDSGLENEGFSGEASGAPKTQKPYHNT